MAVEVVTPEEYMGDVIGDLSSRRGKIGGIEQRGNAQAISRESADREMFGYASDLRSAHPGPGDVHDAVRLLPAGAGNDRPRDRRPRPRRMIHALSTH